MLATLFLFACADKQEDTSVPANSEVEDECSIVPESDCEAAGCAAIYGWPLEQQGDSFCYSEAVYEQERLYAGCTSMVGAITVETYSGPSDGSACWLFSNAPYLEGWVECDE